ncbi:hypothetical protein F5B22DRAFT_650802 [Xylaria bambusicola]|uniref:uncharacterized protein n=1 Tax=Xylaria bambusicola TaxID=326684 RepID=UPI002008C727|nr:uncharacterized protein F5B22DRAFT_650802 [Xylaria bambusicola]KAI0506413.1 hypothetical protein F5B22DRAFT_650802 [Xylaria bambusicola]
MVRHVSTRLQVRHVSIAPSSFRYHVPKVVKEAQPSMNNLRRTSLQEVDSITANSKLTKILRICKQDAENCLRELNDRDSFDVEHINKWIWKFEGQAHKLKSTRRRYMALCTMQILLNIVWSHSYPSNPNRMSMRILGFMQEFERREIQWFGLRDALIQCIESTQRSYTISEASIFQSKEAEEGQQLEDQESWLKIQAAQDQLRRARAIMQASDALLLESLYALNSRVLRRVIDDAMLVTETLEMINNRTWLEEHLATAQEYLSSLQTEISLITGSSTPSLNDDDRYELESIMKLYDLYLTIDKMHLN